jgi:S-adenosylmethionine hydrolase
MQVENMAGKTIALRTDFGMQDPYVEIIKSVVKLRSIEFTPKRTCHG